MPPNIAAYHGRFSEILIRKDISKFNISKDPISFFRISPTHNILASSVSIDIGLDIKPLFLLKSISPEALVRFNKPRSCLLVSESKFFTMASRFKILRVFKKAEFGISLSIEKFLVKKLIFPSRLLSSPMLVH